MPTPPPQCRNPVPTLEDCGLTVTQVFKKEVEGCEEPCIHAVTVQVLFDSSASVGGITAR